MLSFLKRLIPSYRVEEKILGRIDYLEWKIGKLEEINKDLDYKNELLFWLGQRSKGETDIETRRRIFLSFPKAKGLLREYQISILQILTQIKDICEKNGIDYFMDGGTLLGAVRHEGFIPWDDDIDIGIFRKDVSRFIRLINETETLVAKYYYNANEGYRVLKVKYPGYESMYVDVFSFDFFDSTENDFSQRFNAIQLASRRICKELSEEIKNNGSMVLVNELFSDSKLDSIANEIHNRVYKELNYCGSGDYLCLSADEAPAFIEVTGTLLKKEALPIVKDKLIFEGSYFSSLKNYDAYLSQCYGNYLEFPLSIKPKHNTETISLFLKERNQ